MVNGDMGYREFYEGKELDAGLSKDFTVHIRRDRGKSTDTLPYAVERDIEDIEALKNVLEVSEDIMPGPAGSVKV